MKVIILAAGSAKRLGQYTIECPKGLLDINGKTIIETQLTIFKKYGINDITIIVGPNKENFKFKNVEYIFDSDFEEHDVLGSLMTARKLFNQDIVVSYSDILFDDSIFERIINDTKDISIAIDFDWKKSYKDRTEHSIEQADNVVAENNRISKIKKNIQNYNDSQKIGEFIGVMKLSKKGSKIFLRKFEELEKNHIGSFQDAQSFKKAYLTDMLQELIDSGINVSAIPIKGKWCEIDTPQDLENAVKDFN